MLLFNSMYSAEQEEFWSLIEEHLLLEEKRRNAGALYDFDLIMRRKDCLARLSQFGRKHAGRTFRVFRPEDIDQAIRADLSALGDVIPPGMVIDGQP